MIRSLYDWTLRLADTKYALAALAFIAFIESSFFPIPPDIIMIPMIIAAPKRAFLIAGVCMVSSVAGALLGYYIGYGLFELVGQPVLEFYGKMEKFDLFEQRFNDWGVGAILIAGVTPFPFKVITIASGVVQMNLVTFVLASVVARSIRFFVVAALLWKFGEPIRDFIEKRLGLMFTLFCVLLIGGFAIVKYV